MPDETKIDRSTLWRRKGGPADAKRVVVIFTEYTTKDADAANWSQAIGYQIEDASEPVRIRTAQDFASKYEPID